MILNKIYTRDRVKLFTIDDFLTEEQCEHIIQKIDENAQRSQVSGGEKGFEISDYRTSSTATLTGVSDIINEIDNMLHEATNVSKENGEPLQGQRYEIGQEFKMHTDYFDRDSPDFYLHTGESGQRTITFMIYLNDVEEGGETEFHNLGIKFKPKRGQAVVWHNIDENGVENPDTIHSGLPVRKGIKYIITKWFRSGIPTKKEENIESNEQSVIDNHISLGQSLSFNQINNNIPYKENVETVITESISFPPKELPGIKTFRTSNEIPRISELGFKVIDVPERPWKMIQEVYNLLKHTEAPEPNLGSFITSIKNNAANIMSMDHIHEYKNIIHAELQPLHEEWSGHELELATFYGIRSYLDGAVLTAHTDRISELHISSIIVVDEDSNKPWPLDIQDHYGKWHKVLANPGQMILYESSKCSHGRLEPFDGKYFRNAFIHYKLKNYEYVK